MIVADEAYLMIDQKIPQSLIFLRNGLKRGRKYEISLAEEENLELMQKGLALMIIGHMHMKVMFEIAEYKWDYFGSAGGR